MSDALGFQPTPKPDAAVEPWRGVLMDAADYIEAHGWCQGTGHVGDSVCAFIATERVTQPASCPMTPADIALRRAGRLADDKFAAFIGAPNACAIPTWNDAPGRTAAEVCAALRSCAAHPSTIDGQVR